MSGIEWSKKGATKTLTDTMEVMVLNQSAPNAADRNVRVTTADLKAFVMGSTGEDDWVAQPTISVNNATDMVTVSSGEATWDSVGVPYAETTFQKAKPATGLQRIDTVYASEDGTYGYVDGTPSQNPATPAIPTGTLKVGDIIWNEDGAKVYSNTPLLTDRDLFTLPDEVRTYVGYYTDTTDKNFPSGQASFNGIIRVSGRATNGGIIELIPFVGSNRWKCGYYYNGAQRVFEAWQSGASASGDYLEKNGAASQTVATDKPVSFNADTPSAYGSGFRTSWGTFHPHGYGHGFTQQDNLGEDVLVYNENYHKGFHEDLGNFYNIPNPVGAATQSDWQWEYTTATYYGGQTVRDGIFYTTTGTVGRYMVLSTGTTVNKTYQWDATGYYVDGTLFTGGSADLTPYQKKAVAATLGTSGTWSIDLSQSRELYAGTLTGNVTVNISNITDGMVVIVNFKANGSHTVTPAGTYQGGSYTNINGRDHQLWIKGGRNAAGTLTAYYKWWN